MAEEFQTEVWWSSPRTTFNSSSCFSINDMNNYGNSFWQQSDFINIKTKTSDESSNGSLVFPKSGAISPESAVQMMNSPPSATTNWNQALLVRGNARTEVGTYNQTLPEIMNNFPTGTSEDDSSGFDINQQQPLNFITSSGDCTTRNLVSSYGYNPSSLLQTLFDSNSPPTPPQQQPLYDFQANLNDFNPISSMPSKFSSLVKPKQEVHGGLHLANKTPFWNASTSDLNDNRASFFASTQSRFLSSAYEEKPSCPNLKSQNEEIRDLGLSVKKSCSEPTFKRPRLETPSPLPTFKVRKEKLGDRITALQQLVSPFGKTDTASVLHEAIEYIKLLHDQVNVLSTPYIKNGTTMQRRQIHEKVKDMEGAKQQDLRSRGLCLVPVSSTFPVATETAPDYWTPSFGNTFR